jgi:serine/threonine protein kinase
MAPEIILGQGYSHSADLWSLGIMLYEFLFGGVPFGDRENDPSHIYEAILARKLFYPPNIHVSQECKDLIEQLLNRKPILRNGGSCEALKSHEWLKRTEWEKLLSKEIPAPYIPNLTEPSIDVKLILSQNQNLEEIISRETEWDYCPIDAVINTEEHWDDEF